MLKHFYIQRKLNYEEKLNFITKFVKLYHENSNNT